MWTEKTLKNSDFSMGLRYWFRMGQVKLLSGNNRCILESGNRLDTSGVFQSFIAGSDGEFELKLVGKLGSCAKVFVDGANQILECLSSDVGLDVERHLIRFTALKSDKIRFGVRFLHNSKNRDKVYLKSFLLRSKVKAELCRLEPANCSIASLIVPIHSVCRLTLFYTSNHSDNVLLVGRCASTGKQLLKRKLIAEGSEASTILITGESERLLLSFENGAVDIKDLRLERIQARFYQPALEFSDTCVSAALATYPPRHDLLLDVVNSLISQVSHLFIYLNNYRQVPESLIKHPHSERIHTILDSASTKRAAAKFSWAKQVSGYHLICDDDILYPQDYAKRMIAEIERFNRQVVVGVHGASYKLYPQDPISDRSRVFRFTRGLEISTPVHVLGTGTVAWHSQTVRNINFDKLLEHPIANDEGFAVETKRLGIPKVCIKREDQWLRSHPGMKFGIYEEKQLIPGAKSRVAKLIRKSAPWHPPESLG